MNHSFNLQLAKEYGVDTSIFIQSIAFWIHHNLVNQRNLIDGYCWTYNTLEALGEIFPYWTRRQLQRIINGAIRDGLLIKSNHNHNQYNKTNWYALTYKGYGYFPELCDEKFYKRLYSSIAPNGALEYPEWCARVTETVHSITVTNSVANEVPVFNNTNSDCEVIQQTVDVYHEELPELPRVKKVDSKLRVQLKRMIKDWPSYQKDNMEFSIESFRNYLRVIKDNYSWFLKPYETESGTIVKCSLRKLTRELNISKIVNGEFSTTFTGDN